MSLESIILQLSYFGVFLLMIANGIATLPSSQLLYIIAGYFVSTGFFNLWVLLFVGALGNTIGNIILYEIVRSKGLKYITKFKIFPKREIMKVQVAFKKRGVWFVFIGKLIPALKVLVPIPAGLAKMNRIAYITIIFISSFIWASIFIAIGFFFGKSTTVFKAYLPILFVIALIVIWMFYKYMNSEEVRKEIKKNF